MLPWMPERSVMVPSTRPDLHGAAHLDDHRRLDGHLAPGDDHRAPAELDGAAAPAERARRPQQRHHLALDADVAADLPLVERADEARDAGVAGRLVAALDEVHLGRSGDLVLRAGDRLAHAALGQDDLHRAGGLVLSLLDTWL